MILLAVGSVALGGVLAIGDTFFTWLEPVTGHVEHHEPVVPVWTLIVLTHVLVIIGVLIAFRQYAVAAVPVTAPRSNALVRAARRDLYQDTVNESVAMRPGQYLTRSLVYGDRTVVDAGWLGMAGGIGRLGDALRRLQNGYVRSYAAMTLGGLGAVAAVVWALAS
jgi:NADH-quinone oxidoreductase subunit L